jgi:hypothetical protein
MINMGGIYNDVEAVESLHAVPGWALWSHVQMNEYYYRIEFCTRYSSLSLALSLSLEYCI